MLTAEVAAAERREETNGEETARAVAIGAKPEDVAGTAAAQSPGPNSTGSSAGHAVTDGNVIWATGNLLVKVESQGAHVANGSMSHVIWWRNLESWRVVGWNGVRSFGGCLLKSPDLLC